MLYAFMIKVERPEARFRHLELLHVKSRWHVEDRDSKKSVNVNSFLEIIEGTLKNENPKLYAKLKALPHFDTIFDASSYMAVSMDQINRTNPDTTPDQELRLKTLELQSLIMYDRNIVQNITQGSKKDTKRAAKIKQLMQDIITLRSDKSISQASWDTDMGWMDQWLGSATASTNPYVQIYYKLLSERKQEARTKYETWRRKFDTIINRLVKERTGKPLTSLVGGVDRAKLFEFAYKKIENKNGSYRLRLYHEGDSEYKSFTETERRFLDFVNDSHEMFFNNEKSDYVDPRTGKAVALANKVITYRNRKNKEEPVTNLDLFNKNFDNSMTGQKRDKFEYKRGFFGKHQMTLEDVRQKHGYLSKEMLRFLKLKYTTNYFEANYDGWYNTDEVIPMKYLGNSRIDYEQNYTLNLEMATDAFVKQNYYKLYMDDVYTFGQSMKIYLGAKNNADQGVTFDRTIEWFERSLNLHILGHRQKELDLGYRKFGKITTKGFESFNLPKFLRSLKNFFSGPTMWLKPLTGLPNFVFASLVTVKEAVKGSFGIAGGHANFTLGDLASGFKEAFNLFLWDGVKDESFRRNKAYLLMEKFGYLPNSYDWYTQPNQLLTAKNKMFNTRSMMIFHSLPEEIVSTAIFVAQMKAMKTKDGKSVWDHYGEPKTETLSDGVEHTTIAWDGYVRGVRNTSNVDDAPAWENVTELTIEEINAMKFLYEKIHGGYRLDERVALEYYVFGEMVLQLKKYMPSIMKNIGASRGKRTTQGRFLEQGTDENGNSILKWTPQVIEGRYRMLFGMLFNYLGVLGSKTNGQRGNKVLEFLGYSKDESYDWKSLSDAQKADLYDFGLTSLAFIAMLIGANILWDRDDKDTLKKIYGRVANDFAGNVWPFEILKNLTNFATPVAPQKFLKLTTSSAELLWSILLLESGHDDAALTKEGHLRGWMEFSRNLHFLASYHDLVKGIRESDQLDDVYDTYFK